VKSHLFSTEISESSVLKLNRLGKTWGKPGENLGKLLITFFLRIFWQKRERLNFQKSLFFFWVISANIKWFLLKIAFSPKIDSLAGAPVRLKENLE
jgi:hypothetical protein